MSKEWSNSNGVSGDLTLHLTGDLLSITELSSVGKCFGLLVSLISPKFTMLVSAPACLHFHTQVFPEVVSRNSS
jgi:hypothetical protein